MTKEISSLHGGYCKYPQTSKFIAIVMIAIVVFMLGGCGFKGTTTNENNIRTTPIQVNQNKSTTSAELDFPPLREVTPDPNLTLETLETRLLGPYIESGYGGYWTAKQGESVIPLIEKMFQKIDIYTEQHRNGERSIGMFPYNAIYALANIENPQSKVSLEKCIDENFSSDCVLALEAWEYRNSHEGGEETVSFARFPMDLYKSSSESSEVLTSLKKGTKVIILDELISNDDEVGFRGGPMRYQRVRIVDSGIEGYIQQRNDSIYLFI